jgi:hypothetical protein
MNGCNLSVFTEGVFLCQIIRRLISTQKSGMEGGWKTHNSSIIDLRSIHILRDNINHIFPAFLGDRISLFARDDSGGSFLAGHFLRVILYLGAKCPGVREPCSHTCQVNLKYRITHLTTSFSSTTYLYPSQIPNHD